ncbi:MAG TPA: hypothetical protein DCG53_06260 [Syntrophus sp. (in: bacteria)]|nr:hypothetical protein [Syntrophus sp. (in: bacteria)]
MNGPIHIVLDKSYLQGCRSSDLHEIAEKHRFLLCAEAFHEVVSSPENEMKGCVRKLLALNGRVDLLDHNGTLLKYEIENKRSCKPLSHHILPLALNPDWNFSFPQSAIETVTEFNDYWEVQRPKTFDEIVKEIISTCGKIPPVQVASQRDAVLKAYALLRSSHLPLPSAISEDWAIYRRLQVDLIAACEYMDSFQDGQFCIREERKAHNQIDFRVIIAACLAGGVATRDRLIRRYFQLLCPEGVLYWLEG